MMIPIELRREDKNPRGPEDDPDPAIPPIEPGRGAEPGPGPDVDPRRLPDKESEPITES